jgi:hypothetical protein
VKDIFTVRMRRKEKLKEKDGSMIVYIGFEQ